MTPGKRHTVFSIKESPTKNGPASIWVRAGTAWVNRDGSINVYLDVLPLDGKLHIREAATQDGAPAPDAEAEGPKTDG
jgi:hypothetical protein